MRARAFDKGQHRGEPLGVRGRSSGLRPCVSLLVRNAGSLDEDTAARDLLHAVAPVCRRYVGVSPEEEGRRP
jgi:hypothetical protein